MAVVEGLIRAEENGNISFGDYSQTEKKKLDGFSHQGKSYKVKTFREITRLERDGAFVYESTPGTTVLDFQAEDDKLAFRLESDEDAEITVGLAEETEYKVLVDGNEIGVLKSSLSGKLTFSVELNPGEPVSVEIVKA
jgi:hypothetical protein